MNEIRNRTRSGWTLLDVLVPLALALLGMAILVVWLLHARERDRVVRCQDRLKSNGEAIERFAKTNRDALPYLEDGQAGWPVRIWYAEWPAKTYVNPNVPILICPADESRRKNPGGLSYVINGGFGSFTNDQGRIIEPAPHSAEIDLDGNGKASRRERAINRATGVAWRPAKDNWRSTIEDIRNADGLDTTLLLSENRNAGKWQSRDTFDLAFVVGREQFRLDDPTGERALDLPLFDLGPYRPNANAGTLPGASPAPSSPHAGIVNVSFCSGRAQALSENIDPQVYARLLTPAGSNFGEPAP